MSDWLINARFGDRLTKRQGEVANLVMTTGLSNKEIAKMMGVLEGTVKTHLASVFVKLGIYNRSQISIVLKGEMEDSNDSAEYAALMKMLEHYKECIRGQLEKIKSQEDTIAELCRINRLEK